MQPIIDDRFYKLGCDAFRQERYIHACQEWLDSVPDLTSDQYDSFFLGWHDTYRELKGPTVEDIWFPTLPSQIKEREESLQRLKEQGRLAQ
jgi:hypothetical protein